jgi:DNA-binding transcriptional MerR regulator
MGKTVGEVAKLAKVSVRALHHYDEIGLLTPSGRMKSGYRLYTDQDLERLQEVLFFRELGFPLEDIGKILSDRRFDRHAALVAQRALVVEKGERLAAMVALIDKTLVSLEKGVTMSHEEMFEVFGEFDPQAHEEEAEEKWGKTSEFAESRRRTKSYTKDDWQKIKAEGQAITLDFARAMADGVAPTDPRAKDIAERACSHVDRWFYPCPRTMHAALGNMYVDDPRFAANYEKVREGLAEYVRDAIVANAARGE